MAEKKAKAEEKVELPKNPNEYSYRGDEILQIKASDFLAMAKAIEIALQKGTKLCYPTVNKYIASATGIDVPNPTQEEIKTGAVRPIMDVDKTFSQSNIKQEFEPWLVPDIVGAKNIVFEVHAENVKSGNAVHISELKEQEGGTGESKPGEDQPQPDSKPVVEDEAPDPQGNAEAEMEFNPADENGTDENPNIESVANLGTD